MSGSCSGNCSNCGSDCASRQPESLLATAGVVVLLVLAQMLVQVVDPMGQNGNLDLGRTGVAGMGRVLFDDRGLFFFAHHSCVSTFQNNTCSRALSGGSGVCRCENPALSQN